MKRAAVIGLLLISAALVQTALFPYLALGGFRPDLLLLLTAALALRDGPLTGTLVGFSAGLLNDLLLVQATVGISPLVLVCVGYLVGVARPYLALGSVTVPLAIAAGSGLLATLAFGIVSRLLGDPRFSLELIGRASVLVAIYNTLLAPVAFSVAAGISERFPPERAAPL